MRVARKKIMIWGGLGLLLLTSLLLILPRLLNPEYLQELVLEHIQQTVGSQVTVGHTSLALFPSPHFLVSDIVVKEQPDSHAVFRAQSMSLELGLGQLLQKKLVVKEFFLDSPEIEIHRDSSGKWWVLGHSDENSSLSSLASFLVLGKLVVANGKIIIIDESPSDSVRGIVLDNVTCETETSYEGVNVDSSLTVSGNLRQGQDTAPIQLSGTLVGQTNASPSLDRRFIYFDQLAFNGQFETKNIVVSQLAEYVHNGGLLTKFPGNLEVTSQIKWVKKGKGSQLHLSNIALANSAMTLAGNVNVEGLEDGHQMMSVSMRSASLDLKMIRQAVPRAWLPDPLVDIWDKAKWGGELELLEARVIGSTRSDVETSVTGTFRLNNGFLNVPEIPQTEHVTATVSVEPDRIQVSDARGVYDGIPVNVNQGVLFFKELGPWGEVEIQGQVPAKKVWDFVSHLGDSSDNANPMQSWTVSEGDGMLRLRFAGYVLDEDGLVFQQGDYQPQHVTFTIPGLPYSLSHAQGTIQFSPDSTVLKDIQGTVGAYPLTMDGTILHQGDLRLEPLRVHAGFDGQDIFSNKGPVRQQSGIKVRGPLQASVTMRGPVNRLQAKGKIDGEKASLLIPFLLEKEAGQQGTLTFDGQVRSEGTIRVERMELAMLPLRLRGQGVIRYRSTLAWEGRFNSGPISIGLLPNKVHMFGNAMETGIFELQLGGKGVGRDWKKWDVKGWMAMTDGVANIPGIEETIENVFVRLRIDRDLLDLKRMEFRMRESEAVVKGFMRNWHTNPQVSLMWESPRFDIDLLIPKEERSILRDGFEWLADYGKLEGSILVDQPIYKAFSGQKLSAAISIHDNLVSIDKIQTMVEKEGSLKGRVFVLLPPGKPAAMRASFDGNNLPFEKFLLVLGDERRFVSGSMNIRGMLQGHGRNPRGVIPSLHGGIQLSLRDGYVRKETILPKILGILNLPHVLRDKVSLEKTGFPFEGISTSLKIEEGSFSTKDFLLRSPIMKATAAGMYDLDRDDLNAVAAVSPFGAYSDTLQSIPLFGKIFSGDRKGIATAMFAMRGQLGEPQIAYMPKESLKNGLTGLAQLAFDVLKNTVLVPVKVLNGSNAERSSSTPESSNLTPQQPSETTAR